MNRKQKISLFIILVALNFIWGILYPPAAGDNPGVNYLVILIGAFPLLMGFWFVTDGFKYYNLAVESQHWDVISGLMGEKTIKASAGSNADRRMSDYRPYITYTYAPNGVELERHTINFYKTPAFNDETRAQKVLDDLPDEGQKIDVYYSMGRNMSVLNPGTKGMNKLGLIAGCFVFATGLWITKIAF